jgi:hypothetical protein
LDFVHHIKKKKEKYIGEGKRKTKGKAQYDDKVQNKNPSPNS